MATEGKESAIVENRSLKAEQNLRCASDKFFALSLDMLFVVGLDGYIKQLNPMSEKTLGFTTKEFLSLPLLEFVHPQDREFTLAQFEKLENITETVSFENRCRCKDGSYKWLLWNATLSQEEQLIYLVARDITASKQEKQALQETEERYRLLVESVKDYAIYMLDPQGHVISWNPGAERLKRYRAEEIIGKHFSCFYLSEDIKQGKPEQELRVAQAEGRYEDEGWRVRKDGSRFLANAVVTALRGKDGQLRGFAKVTRDITERKLAQEALQQANDELEKRVEERTAELTQANALLRQEIDVRKRTEVALRQSKAHLKEQAKQLEEALHELHSTQAQLIQKEKMSSLGQLVAGIAHEINNPVSFIYCNLDYANRYVQDLLHLLRLYQQNFPQSTPEIVEAESAIDLDFLVADITKLLSSMKRGAKRIHEIVLSLRNFARHDEAEMKFVNIHEGIDSTLSLLQNRLKATEGCPPIQVIQAYGDLPLVECYPGLLNQVFMNLFANAIDALEELERSKVDTLSPSHPTIIIRTEVVGQRVRISVADNGPGMTEEVRRRLYDPFFTTKSVGQGIGLGLSICYQIVVEKHRGQLNCISQPGKGAEFVIEIPVFARSTQPTSFQSKTEVSSQQQLALN
ncbi:PAS domain S-box protein [Planktothrix sp. FACHB-1355]|uniref:histidine kinase n=1 Tax=Aerosakkonema funiforme FACHB-1375 TaxID=2949571 RepID=A0A926VFJ4_9CYAN|nr:MULTISPECIES: PAS domain S-box protein [Oscillatoriales]MBD2181634.1 PAS domain S-box protein [Aerosakkonema funiforme FACHB-1375]MBD3559790.1 PAS domain S-box protein [Planktothrix sp. FACHB-1355]